MATDAAAQATSDLPQGVPPRSIATPRLLLRPVVYDDASALHALLSDPEACRFSPHPPLQSEAAMRWLIVAWHEQRAQGLDSFVIASLHRPGELLGLVQVRRDGELGGMIAPRHAGLGLGPEAIEAVASRLDLPELWTIIDADHEALAKVLLRSGFVAERRLAAHRVHPLLGQAKRDCILYRRHSGERNSAVRRT